MRKLALIVAVIGMIFAFTTPAGAVTDTYLEMEGPSYFTGDGEFITTRGPLCPSGTTEDIENDGTAFDGRGFNLRVVKEFTCDDGSGTFQADLRVRISFFSGVSFTWNMNRGTGDYEHIRGRGYGFVAFPVDDGVYDVYRGSVRVW